jgi:hypothetical protein
MTARCQRGDGKITAITPITHQGTVVPSPNRSQVGGSSGFRLTVVPHQSPIRKQDAHVSLTAWSMTAWQ